MTVRELIERLQAFDPDLPIYWERANGEVEASGFYRPYEAPAEIKKLPLPRRVVI